MRLALILAAIVALAPGCKKDTAQPSPSPSPAPAVTAMPDAAPAAPMSHAGPAWKKPERCKETAGCDAGP